MSLALMQPYFMPYIGYFQLIHCVDSWISFDSAQYIKAGWINRNRIVNPMQKVGWQYIGIPLLKHNSSAKISQILIDDRICWRRKILGKLSIYAKAPYFDQTIELVENCFQCDSPHLSEFLFNSIELVCNHLGIQGNLLRFSRLEVDLDKASHAGEWGAIVSKAHNADEYINSPGGKQFFRLQDYQSRGVKLKFINPLIRKYIHSNQLQIESLSILDTLMWCGREETMDIISNDFDLEEAIE